MTESIVRIATSADHDEIWRLLELAHAEHALLPYDPERVEWWLDRMLSPEKILPWDTGPRGVIGVIGTPEKLEGMAFLTISAFWYSAKRHLEELLVFVDPECRPSKHARALIDWMKQQSVATGLPLMTGILSTQRTDAKIRLYERLLPKAGAVFCFNPLTQSSSSFAVMH